MSKVRFGDLEVEIKCATILWGISASGKSTHAKVYKGKTEINRDNIRFSEFLSPVDQWKDWDWKYEKAVTQIWKQQLQNAIDAREDIVITDTNLDKEKRMALIDKLKKEGYSVTSILLWIDPEEAKRRDRNRGRPVGDAVIDKQFSKLIQEGWDENTEFVWRVSNEI